ncbi:MAG: hypothetical protein AAFU71_07445 [Cyanobacteria bacterium J06632_22]
MPAFLQLMGVLIVLAAGMTLIAGSLNTLFDWNLALKIGGSAIDLPTDFTEVVIVSILLALLGGLFYGLGNIDRVFDWVRRYRWRVLIGLAATVALVIIGTPALFPNLSLELAIQGGNSAKAQALLQKRNYPPDVLNDLLYWSLMEEDPIVTQLMLDQGANINHRRGEFNSTLLHNAVLFMPASATEFLLVHGIDVNAMDTYNRNALHELLKHRANNTADDEAEILFLTQQLVSAGIDITATNTFDETPLTLAQAQGYDTVIAYLQAK